MSDPAFAKLKRLKINKYRSIKPGTELRFADGINVLLGKNGSGKTTLLNLLAMVVSGNFYPIRREEFSLEYEFGLADNSARFIVKIQNISVETENIPNFKLESHSCSFDISYFWSIGVDSFERQVNATQSAKTELTIRYNQSTPTHEILSNELGPLSERGINFHATMAIFSNVSQSPLKAEIITPLFRFDEARDSLRELTSSSIRLIVSTDIRGPGDVSAMKHPQDIISGLAEAFSKEPDSAAFVLSSQNIQSIAQITAKLGYALSQVIFEPKAKEGIFLTFEPPRFRFRKTDGTMVRLEDLSFGEQRLFAYYYYLACSPQMLIADELSNGMHHEMVRGCIEAIGPRQAFLATQNPLLLDYLEFASLDAVRESFVLCSREPGEDREWMTMRQMSDDEGREFFGHYQAERSHVNEILRSLGLW